MQYKMQFTVLDDAVKQNRKLPEIAFFDTDGNLIHLGGGGDGGGDVSALLPLDGSRAMTGPLEFASPTDVNVATFERQDIWDAPDYMPLVFSMPGGVETDFVSTGGFQFIHADDPTLIDSGNPPYANIANGSIQGGNGMGSSFGVYPGHIRIDQGVEDFITNPSDPFALGIFDENWQIPRFAVNRVGRLAWSDGTDAPDVTLERTAPGTLEIDHILSFKGDAGDDTSGVSMHWDETAYGLVVDGKVGSGGASLYVQDIEDPTTFAGLFTGGVTATHGDKRVMLNAYDGSLLFMGDGDFTRLKWISPGVLELAPPEGPGHSALRLHSPNGSLFDVSVANDGTLSAVPV